MFTCPLKKIFQFMKPLNVKENMKKKRFKNVEYQNAKQSYMRKMNIHANFVGKGTA